MKPSIRAYLANGERSCYRLVYLMELSMERLALTILEACEVAGIGRTTLYAAIARGELAARKRGRRTLVPVDDLRKWINSLPTLVVGGLNEQLD